jgi:glyoxylase-like metal-dependent hydrolase (beta-lactamase superfamily II)
MEYLEQVGLRPEKILLTHTHWDHIVDCAALQSELGIPVYVHPLDAGNLEVPGSDGLPLWAAIDPVTPDVLLREDDVIAVGNLQFKVLHTPGHSPGSVCFHCPEEKLLIAGDTLFRGSIGNLALPTAEADKMWASLEKLAKLPPETKVLPGHGPATTIGAEPWLPEAKSFFNG